MKGNACEVNLCSKTLHVSYPGIRYEISLYYLSLFVVVAAVAVVEKIHIQIIWNTKKDS